MFSTTMNRPHRARHSKRSRSGSFVVIAGVALVVFLGFGALAIDLAWLRLVRLQSQNAADAGAHAALVELKRSQDTSTARSVAEAVVAMNSVGGRAARLDPQHTRFGAWDFPSRSFTIGDDYVNSVEVQVERSGAASLGPVDLWLSAVLPSGHSWGVADRAATGALRPREIVVVQDVTGSFAQEIDLARIADLALLDYMHESGFPDDRIGMTVFTGGAELWTPLGDVRDTYGSVYSQWDTLDWCDKDNDPDGSENGNDHMLDCRTGGDGTDQGTGIDLAVDTLLASSRDHALKVIVLVSDGRPQCYDNPSCSAADRWNSGVLAAARARDNDISIFSVSFNESYNATQSAYLESLATGYGQFYETPDEHELPDILETVARNIPIALVE